MNARIKNLLWNTAAGIVFWALCKNRKLMIYVSQKMIAQLSVEELIAVSFDIKEAVKNVKP
jgi:hypothetical protein